MTSPDRRRTFLFWGITLSIPFLLFLILEIVLRVIDYGINEPLVIVQSAGGRQVYSINRAVARRYFSGERSVIPEPADDKFEYEKSDSTLRIFCLGESTMAGFPYDFNATAPSFLKDRLQAAYPNHKIEVVNVGVSAVGSYIVLEFLEELMQYQPDLFVIYVGHNEFYGAYGVASTFGAGGNPVLTRLSLSLLQVRTYQLIRDGLSGLLGLFESPGMETGSTLMAEVIGEEEIPYGSGPYETARNTFRANVADMITVCQDRGVPVLFSTLVSNLRDHPPFRSAFTPDLPPGERALTLHLLGRADSLIQMRSLQDALVAAEEALSIDSGYAMSWFTLGKALDADGMHADAKDAYMRARDYDLLRFRASDELQRDLLSMCATYKVPAARVDSAFEAQSPDGLPGGSLFTEHLHPTVRGYFLMAKVFGETILSHRLLRVESESLPASADIDSSLFHLSGVTRFDEMVGRIKTNLLTHRWPFVREAQPYFFSPASREEEIAYRYVQGKTAWSAARYELAEFYAGVKRFDLARDECRAVSKVVSTSYEPLLRVADYYRREGKHQEAIAAYIHSYTVEDNPFARLKLSMVYLEEHNPSGAREEIEYALSMEHADRLLDKSAQGLAHYLLGVAYAQLSDFGKARENGEAALRLDPSLSQAQDLLDQIEAARRQRRRR